MVPPGVLWMVNTIWARSAPAPGALSQQAAVAGDDPGVVAVVMERMRIAAAADHPHEDLLAGVEHGHGVIGLGRQPGGIGRQHGVRARPAIDEPIDRHTRRPYPRRGSRRGWRRGLVGLDLHFHRVVDVSSISVSRNRYSWSNGAVGVGVGPAMAHRVEPVGRTISAPTRPISICRSGRVPL